MISAHYLATRYDQYAADLWLGKNACAVLFVTWLARYWSEAPAEPDTPPDAISLLGGTGRGIHWYETDAVVLGYVRDWDGAFCYRVPKTAVLPPRARECDGDEGLAHDLPPSHAEPASIQ